MALTPYVYVGVATGTLNGTYTATLANQKSYAYDEPPYQVQSNVHLQIIQAVGTFSLSNSGTAVYVAPSTQQLKSITITPTVTPTAVDYLTLNQYTVYPVSYIQGTFTATGTTILGLGLSGNGTLEGTGINKVTFTILTQAGTLGGLPGVGAGTAVGGASGTQFAGLGTQSAWNPSYLQIDGALGTVIVTGPGGTNTCPGYVFPSGPNGGITVNAGDVLVLCKGTDTVANYAITLEMQITSGGQVTK